MKKLAIIIVWHGLLPEHFKFWYASAKNNQTIDFLIFTDQKIEAKENIIVYEMPFPELKLLVESKFDFPVKCQSPMKFCDYRSAYGLIFSDYIKDYDFWAFGDIDLTYGDIRYFLTDDILKKYDMFGSWGHLTFYRNNEECNTFFMTKKKGFQYYKDVFSREEKTLFEEPMCRGVGDMWWELKPERCYRDVIYDDIAIPMQELDFVSNFKSPHNSLIFEYSNKNLFRIFLDEHGKIRREKSLYVHFQKRQFMMPIETDSSDNYLMVPNRYIDWRPLNEKEVKSLSKYSRLKKTSYYMINKMRYDIKMKLKNSLIARRT